MKLPRDTSGCDVVKAPCRDWGYREVRQVGSHVILQSDQPTPHRLSVPDHHPIRAAMLHAIIRAVAHHKGMDRLHVLSTL
jgi:predicted RNA binding protein YcfA (HicA-like mRNA interferase family)